MPVSTETSIAGPFYPNGSTVDFPFDFKATRADEVVAVDGEGATISTALYSVALDEDEGGTLSFSVAPEASDYPEIYVVANPALTQPSDFDNAGPSYNPAAVTRAFDRAAVRDLKQQREIDRSLKFPFGTVAPEMPSLATMAGKFLAFTVGGLIIASAGTGADAGLRTDLAAVTGAGMVAFDAGQSYGAGSVGEALKEMKVATDFIKRDYTSGNFITGSEDSGSLLNNTAAGTKNGDMNTGYGFGVFNVATTTYASTGVGYGALNKVTTAHSNSAFAYQAGHNLTTGIMNTLGGVDAGLLSQTMSYCTVWGHHCLNLGAFTGQGAVVIGQQTARNFTTGDYMIWIGRNAGANSPATGSAYCTVAGGASAIAAAVNQSEIYGAEIVQVSGSVATSFLGGYRNNYGTTSAVNTVSIGAFGFFRGSGASIGASVGIGVDHGYSIQGVNNVFVGYRAGYNSTSKTVDGAVAIGAYAAFNDINTGDLVIANGDLVANRLIWGNFVSKVLKLRGDHLTLVDLPSAANDAGAASAGLALNEIYFNTTIGALRPRAA